MGEVHQNRTSLHNKSRSIECQKIVLRVGLKIAKVKAVKTAPDQAPSPGEHQTLNTFQIRIGVQY